MKSMTRFDGNMKTKSAYTNQ